MTDPNSSRPENPNAPGPGLPEDPFVRFDARVLDPASAVRQPGEDDEPAAAPSTTAYRIDRLLLRSGTSAGIRDLIDLVGTVAAELELQVAGPDPLTEREGSEEQDPEIARHNQLARLLALAERTGTPLVAPIRLARVAGEPAAAVDVWPLLQRLRSRGAALDGSIGLDHLMFAAVSINGNPYGPKGLALVGGDPYGPKGLSSGGVASYAVPGTGGHGPVSVVVASPQPTPGACSPRVVVLDTGVGRHPWFDDRPAQRELRVSTGDPIGLDVGLPRVQETDPEGRGAVADPMTGELASHAGHGTFIAGLLRQACPDADIVGLRIMDADGVVPESYLTTALIGLGTLLAEKPGHVDALVLSLGYYAETAHDQDYTAALKDLLVTLAARGVVTFAAAGNDSTTKRSYPAAFADDAAFAAPGLPLVAVAALNPDGSVALFSNDGDWVNGEAAGANVVSTAPATAQGSSQPSLSVIDPQGRERATIDPDDYSSGFATWSGTSFAAPVLAGAYLTALVANTCPDVSQRRDLVPLDRRVARPQGRPAPFPPDRNLDDR